ncbi:MAG TPA: choice-of-anchor Q domain-containing protein, partial [Solirubrobacteraceae bacterium]|nr:choice-of-anchor Q domain-containing protein [Solirubrobacteraceae bacterium]
TVADNLLGAGGTRGAAGGNRATRGSGGGVFVDSRRPTDDMGLRNTIVASNGAPDCGRNTPSAITDRGHDLSYGDGTCPGGHGNPKLGRLQYNGGDTDTVALEPGSAAIDRIPASHADCPATDQRGVSRPQGRGCDIGAFEFALPTITVEAPGRHASYERGSHIPARFTCREGGITSPIAACRGTVPAGHALGTRFAGRKRFTVTAVDRTGNRVKITVRYTVWAYANPLRAIAGLSPERIDMGVDYAGSGPLLALGDGRVTMASNHDSGPRSCWGKSCWPGGGIVVYRLTQGPFAGKYVYVAENITVRVRRGERLKTGQPVATLHDASPNMETGWAAGHGAETLAFRDGHECTCGDPGGWSTIEGRNFDHLLTWLGAPSGYLQPNPPAQSMPRGWPRVPSR